MVVVLGGSFGAARTGKSHRSLSASSSGQDSGSPCTLHARLPLPFLVFMVIQLLNEAHPSSLPRPSSPLQPQSPQL